LCFLLCFVNCWSLFCQILICMSSRWSIYGNTTQWQIEYSVCVWHIYAGLRQRGRGKRGGGVPASHFCNSNFLQSLPSIFGMLSNFPTGKWLTNVTYVYPIYVSLMWSPSIRGPLPQPLPSVHHAPIMQNICTRQGRSIFFWRIPLHVGNVWLLFCGSLS